MSDTSVPKVTCDSCGKQYKWSEQLAGKRVKCKCGAKFTVPAALENAEPDLAEMFSEDDEAVAVATKTATKTAAASCPSCSAAVKAGAVICTSCGFNLRDGKQLKTQFGVVRTPTAATGKPRRVRTGEPDGFFGKFARSWELAKISYGILWDFKQLVIFP